MNRSPARHTQSGVVLLEAMIAILIISFGILGIVGLQANAIKMTTDSRYRIDAGAFADRIVAEMWVNTPNIANYEWTGAGAPPGELVAWVNDMQNPARPGYLPGSDLYPPTIDIDADNRVTIRIRWAKQHTSPLDTVPYHEYLAVAAINHMPEN